jgi:hypothetical protein
MTWHVAYVFLYVFGLVVGFGLVALVLLMIGDAISEWRWRRRG